MDLISRAAAIAEIEDYIEEYSGVDMETGLHNPKWCAMVEAKDVLAKLPAAQTCGWISVEDRLPEDERFVLVCNDDGKMMVAQYIAETAQWQFRYMAYDVDVWDDTEQGPVEWWMPLPEVPKEENDNEDAQS